MRKKKKVNEIYDIEKNPEIQIDKLKIYYDMLLSCGIYGG